MSHLTYLANDDEINLFDQALQDYQGLQMDVDRFTAARLQMGIYGQRQEGVNMVRIKLPGGRVSGPQLDVIADMLEKYARHDVVHITTRQDIQMHYVPLEHTPAVLRHLATAGLTTREACGNTIRNVTACSLAGVCPRQHVDVTKHLDGAVQHFLRNPLTQQMPRKFKISFSACESDCAQGMMHDLGIVAVRDGARFGFKVMAGGGLGHKPHEAIIIEEFIEEKDLLLVMEAVISLHNRYSDRVKRAKARIKFLVDKFGPEGFVQKYREELARVKVALAAQDYPQGEWSPGADGEAPGIGAPRHVFAQKQPGHYVFPIGVPMGNLNVAQLRGLARITKAHGLDEIRATQDQNMFLPNVPAEKIESLRAELAVLGLAEPKTGDNVVACPGTSTCRLGITSSTVVAPKLSGGAHDLKIRVSGCHNGCAQPETGDIGIYGEGKRMHGKLVPHYQMYFGGDGMAGGALAIKGPSVPSARIETAVERVTSAFESERASDEAFFAWTRRVGKEYFASLLADLTEVRPEELPSVLRDHGKDGDFKVLQLGGGECAGVSQVKIGSSFFDAAHERNYRDALKFQRKFEESVKCAEEIARLISQGVAELLGGAKHDDLAAQAEELGRMLPTKPQLSRQLARFAENFSLSPEEFDDIKLTEWFSELDAWTMEAAEFCLGFDRQLDLAGALPLKAVARSPLHRAQSSAVV
ncbi:MAG TPA: nitrite/sulfite reductase [Nitrosospira sp.]|jgi:sulfite reductase (NADPH) hemoprotein beta-component|nr:nitrite/sulfite reductase [Nitrosospira sp.]